MARASFLKACVLSVSVLGCASCSPHPVNTGDVPALKASDNAAVQRDFECEVVMISKGTVDKEKSAEASAADVSKAMFFHGRLTAFDPNRKWQPMLVKAVSADTPSTVAARLDRGPVCDALFRSEFQ